MRAADTIEAINREQLVTATDRLLIRGGRSAKSRPTVPSAAFMYDWQSSTAREHGRQVDHSPAAARASIEVRLDLHQIP
jgi:hypothetical protein